MSTRWAVNAISWLRELIATAWFTRLAYIRLAFHGARIGSHLSVRGPLNLHIHHSGRIELGDYCRLNSGFNSNPVGASTRMTVWVGPQGRLKIGDRVGLSNSTIVCMNSVSIADDVFIGGDCKIYDTDFHPIPMADRIHNLTAPSVAPIAIGRGSFIGGHSILLKGTIIGEGAVIGSGSVVAGSIPAFEIWAGNPARFIKKIEP